MTPAGLTLRQLRILAAIECTGSLAGAAEQMHLTPPAVHTQLGALEGHLGCRLVVRGSGKRSFLTPEGRRLCVAASEVETALGRAVDEIKALKQGKRGRVCLGVVSTGKYFAPHLVAEVKEMNPEIDLVLRVGNRDEIITLLQRGALDIVIMGRPPRRPEVVATPIGEHPHVLIAPAGHPLVGQREIEAEELLQETFIAREPGSGTRILMIRFLDRIGEGTSYEMIEMDSNETIKQAVLAGLGIALISRHTVMEELHSGRLVELPFPDLPIIRQWFLLHPTQSPPRGAAATVFKSILAQGGRFLSDRR